MNIRDVLLVGGIGYRKSKEAEHRGSSGEGYINIEVYFRNKYLDFDDLAADDWIAKPQELMLTKFQIVEAVASALKERGIIYHGPEQTFLESVADELTTVLKILGFNGTN